MAASHALPKDRARNVQIVVLHRIMKNCVVVVGGPQDAAGRGKPTKCGKHFLSFLFLFFLYLSLQVSLILTLFWGKSARIKVNCNVLGGCVSVSPDFV